MPTGKEKDEREGSAWKGERGDEKEKDVCLKEVDGGSVDVMHMLGDEGGRPLRRRGIHERD